MSDKDILSQLNKLKGVAPDSSWKENSRGVLLNQIYGFGVEKEKLGFFASLYHSLPVQVMRTVSQPVMVVFALVAVLAGGGLGLRIAQETKPGDSLYVAKIVGERTQRVFTFDDKEKLRLEIEFAKNRAEEMDEILAGEGQNEKQLEKAVSGFNESMVVIKAKLKEMEKMGRVEKEVAVAPVDKQVETPAVNEEEDVVFSANSEKDTTGMQTSEKDESDVATGTDDKIKKEEIKDINTKSILEEAGQLLDGDDYAATINKLNEAEEMVTGITGETKASSTEETENNEESTKSEE